MAIAQRYDCYKIILFWYMFATGNDLVTEVVKRGLTSIETLEWGA